jgi:hypothetical protein
MSGPKVNAYELVRRRREMEARKLEQERFRREEELRRRKDAENAQRISYEAACELAGVQAAKESDEEWLKQETVRIEALLLEQREKQIIREEIEQVMEQLGYTVIGEKDTTRKSGRTVHEEVYSYGEGTAINVTEADGQITMEVVGVDTSDRVPTEAESEYLEEEMVSFCGVHTQVEQLLEERGIVLSRRIQKNPPSREYAQILNINDYEQKQTHISMIQSVDMRAAGKGEAHGYDKNMSQM